jgi:hypothetical protein
MAVPVITPPQLPPATPGAGVEPVRRPGPERRQARDDWSRRQRRRPSPDEEPGDAGHEEHDAGGRPTTGRIDVLA